MKHAKRIGALICVFAICFTLMCAPSAHAVGALGGQAAGAWIAAGLVALNIVAHTGAQAIGSYFGWQAAPSSQNVLEYAFPNATSVISDYMNASTVVVRQGVTTIDGVEYDEVFVDPGTFTNGLKTNLFDFKTKWNIISGQSGITLASGWGNYNGANLYSVNGTVRSPTYGPINRGESVGVGNGSMSVGNIPDTWEYFRYDYGSGSPINIGNRQVPPFTGWIYVSGNSPIVRYRSTYGYEQQMGLDTSLLVNQPFNYTYTSGVVPADESDIPSNYGLSIQIPHDKLQTFYSTYPEYNHNNVTINIQEDEVDIDQLTQAIFDQITSMDQVKASWAESAEPVPPEPGPPEPVPPEPAEDVLEGVNTVAEQQYQSNQIQYQSYTAQQQQIQNQQQQIQNQQQQIQQQQQINDNVGDIKDSIEQITDTPTSQELPDFKFDLREFFPFCIPFDIYNLLTTFDAEPVAPHVQIPFVIESLNFSYNIDLDFSVFDPVAQVLRTVEFIVYALGLAWATGKVIKW